MRVEAAYSVRGIYGSGLSSSGIRGPLRLGFSLIDTGPYREKLDRLAARWNWPDSDPSLWLANHPELKRQVAIENGS